MNAEEVIKDLIIGNASESRSEDVTVFKIRYKTKHFIAAIPRDDWESREQLLDRAGQILFAKVCNETTTPSKAVYIYPEDDEDIQDETPTDPALFEEFKEKEAKKKEKFLNYPLVDVKEFTTRLSTVLWNNEILYVRDLLSRTQAEFMQIPRFGVGMMKQIKSFVTKHGFKMKK